MIGVAGPPNGLETMRRAEPLLVAGGLEERWFHSRAEATKNDAHVLVCVGSRGGVAGRTFGPIGGAGSCTAGASAILRGGERSSSGTAHRQQHHRGAG